ncbi:MAG: hypothetical protein KME17_05650 [Cyanosarcina radialis HA8281-LM2]|nr:hypothetical protein [Cyanosarcina radialis HA8281-LM2]
MLEPPITCVGISLCGSTYRHLKIEVISFESRSKTLMFNAIDLWVPLVLLGAIVLAAIFFSRSS